MISPFTNPSYLLPPLVAFVLSVGLAVFIWRTRPKKDLSMKLFIGMLISMGVWGLVLFGMRTSPDVERALLWDRGMPAASLATFVFLYHFTHAYTNARGQRAIIIAAYIGLVITAALSPSTSLFVEQMRVEDYGYAPVVGIGSYIVILSFLPLTAAAIRNLIKRYRASPSYEERNRLIYLVIGAVLIVTGAYLDVLTNLPPALIKTNIAFSILVTVAVVKYNLLDIRSIARKGLAYVITSSAIAAPYILVMIYLTRTIGLERSPIWLHAIMIVLISIGIRPLYAWSQQLVDRWFYRGRYDYLKALEEFVGQTQSITYLKQLCNTVVKLVSGAMQTSCAYLLLPSEEKKGLVIESATCASELKSETILKNSSASTKWLKRHSDIVSLDQFDIHPQLQSLSSAEKKKLEDMGAHLIVPIKTKEGQLSGLLILGQKLSQQPFSFEDKQLLKALSSHVAMAVSNALLYEEVKRSEEALRESEEKLRLTFDSMAEGIAVADPSANIIKVNKALLQMYGHDRKEELIGKSVFNLMPEGDRAEARRNIEKILGGKYVASGESTGLKKDGMEFSIEISSAAMRDPTSGIPAGFVTIIEDITKRKQTQEKIEKSRKQLRALYARLNSVREEERTRIAREIHDELGQSLTALKMDLFWLCKRLPKEQEKLIGRIDSMTDLVGNSINSVKSISSKLRPGILDDLGIVAAIEYESKEFQERTGVKCKLKLMDQDVEMDPEIATAIFRIFQEALTNVLRHANATQVDVSLKRRANSIVLEVKDNGRGITEEQNSDPESLGLLGMKERASFHGGEVKIQGIQGKGTTLTVSIPLERKGETQ